MALQWDKTFHDIVAGKSLLQNMLNSSPYAVKNNPLFSPETIEDLKNYKFSLSVYDANVSIGFAATEGSTTGVSSSTFIFRNTPDAFDDVNPNRTSVTQTRGGLWIEDFGSGIREMSLSGNTGFRKLNLGTATDTSEYNMDGKQICTKLVTFFQRYNKNRKAYLESGIGIDSGLSGDYRKYLMILSIYGERTASGASNTFLIVHPMSYKISRSKQSPMLYFYDIKLVVLGDMDEYLGKNNFADEYKDHVANLNDYTLRINKTISSYNQYWATYMVAQQKVKDIFKYVGGGDFGLGKLESNLTGFYSWLNIPKTTNLGIDLSSLVSVASSIAEVTVKVLDDINNNICGAGYYKTGNISPDQLSMTIAVAQANGNTATSVITETAAKAVVASSVKKNSNPNILGNDEYNKNTETALAAIKDRNRVTNSVPKCNFSFDDLNNLVGNQLPSQILILEQLAHQLAPSSFLGADTAIFNLVRELRQTQACLSNFRSFKEFFENGFNDYVQNARAQLMDSGCATTIKVE